MMKSLYIRIHTKALISFLILMPFFFCATAHAGTFSHKAGINANIPAYPSLNRLSSELSDYYSNNILPDFTFYSLNSALKNDVISNNAGAYYISSTAVPAPPTIICPVNIVTVNDAGKCSTTIIGISATINDPDGDITTLTWTMTGATNDASPVTGINNIINPYDFNVGITTVTYTVTDAGGSSVSCSFTVTIIDVELPLITCPLNENATYTEGICSANVVIGAPVATDNCGINTITGIRSDGLALSDIFPDGITTITWTAIDIHGNASSCIQTVKVTPGILLVNYDFVGASAYPIFPNQTATGINSEATSSEPFNVLSTGGTVTGNQAFVNNPVANPAIYMDPSTGTNTRYFQFHISGDSLYKYRKFKLYVQARRGNRAAQTINFAYSTDPFSFTVNGSLALISSGTWYETVVDWSTIALINNRSDLYIRLFASNGTGGAGDGRLFIDNFQVIGVDGPLARPNLVTIPENTTVNIPVLVNDTYGCNGPALMNAISITSFPAQGVATLNPDSTFSYTPNENVNGTDSFIYQICDASGSCDTSIVNITITPVSYAPVVSCPGNILSGSDIGLCGALVNDLSANYFDQDNNIVSLTWTMIGANNASSPPTGINNLASYTFTAGISTIQYIITDADGGADTCSYTVTVYDSENPSMVCPGDSIFFIPDCALLTEPVILSPPVIADNCGILNLINNAPAQFPEGITSVLWTATDINGNSSVCEQFVIVNKLAPMSITASSTPVSCFAGNNGTATVSASGGVLPYTYLWNTLPPQTGQTALNLTAGLYTVIVTDSAGCSDTTSVIVTQPSDSLTLSVTNIVNVNCYGNSTGSFIVTASGGTPGYTYSLNGGAYQSSGTFLNLSAGTFTIAVLDANNCSDSTFVIISEPDTALSVQITSLDTVLCAGQATGTATALAAGGVPPYFYTWNTVPVQNTATAIGLIAGTYIVSVTDSNGCGPVTATAIVPELPPLIVSAIFDPILCPGGTTSVTLLASGGTAPYIYTFNGVIQAGDSIFTAIPAGLAYNWSVSDANGCGPAIGTLTVNEPDPLTASVLILTPIPCIGGTATVVIQASGGTAPYTYTFNGITQVGNGVFTSVPAGLGYVWSVNDTNACGPVTGTIDITEPPIPSATASVTVPILCAGGTATVTIIGATGTPPFTFTFNGVTQIGNGVFTGIPAGPGYNWSLTDASGCGPVNGILAVTEPDTLTASAFISTPIACAGDSATVTLQASGGTTPYIYTFNGVTQAGNGVFTAILPGTGYSWSVDDSVGCGPVTGTIDVTEPAVFTASISILSTIPCTGATVVIQASGGTAPYTYTFNGITQVGNGVFTSILTGSYIWSADDANGCGPVTGTIDVIGAVNPLIGTIVDQTDVSCFGESDGSATVSGSGGIPPYTYLWNTVPVQNTATASNLAAGNYTVTITDSVGCALPLTITINEPDSITISITQVDVACFGDSTGSATALASGGTPPYSYAWLTVPIQTTATISNLPAGTYSLAVFDSLGCFMPAFVTITQPALPLTAIITNQVNEDCTGNNTGSVTIAGSGGTPPYQYSLNGGAFQSGGTFNNLAAGVYPVSVRDTNNCLYTGLSVIITGPANPLTATITNQTNISCNGETDGSVTVAASGGVSPYTYSWNTVPVQTTATASNLGVGNYTLTITDSVGCVLLFDVIVTEPVPIVISISTVNVSCFGDSTGSATALASGGTPPYSYAWLTTPIQTTATITNLPAGIYSLAVFDSLGCFMPAFVTITQPVAPLTATVTNQVNAACTGGNTGSFTVAANGGTPPYQYSVNGGAYQSSGTFNNLAAGLYTISVRDTNNCLFNSLSVTITGPANPLTAAITSQTDVLCNGEATGSATVTASGGVVPYTYSWNTVPVQNTSTASNLPAGNYIVTITDSTGCVLTLPVTITEHDPITILLTTVNVACFGDSTGSVTAQASGGIPPYTYAWMTVPIQTSPTISNLLAGTYTLVVFDSLGCFMPAFVTITQPASALTATITNQVNAACTGGNTGSFTVAASGGTSPYLYSVNGGAYQPDGTFDSLAAGLYTISVRDTNNCLFNSLSVIITGPANPLTATIISQTNVTCYGQSTGSATVAASGGASPYTYSWNTIPVQTTPTASNLAAGNYIVTITDSTGCVLPFDVTISQPDSITITITKVDVACFGDSTGSATAIASGGTPPYTYSWLTVPVQTNPTITNLAPGIYTINVVDSLGCSNSAVTTISQPASALTASITSQTNEDCAGNANGSVTVAGTGGTPGYQYSLNGGTFQSNGTFTGLAAGSYTVTVQDTNNCTTDVAVQIIVSGILVAVDDFYSTLINIPVIDNVMTNDLGLCFPPVNVTANTSPLNGSVVMNADGSFTYTPSLNYSGTDSFTYTITDSNGADSTAVVFITINDLINDPPVTFNEYIIVSFNQPESGNVLLNGDYDPEGTALTVNPIPVVNPTNGTFSILADGSFTYTPNLNYTGNDIVVVSVCDSGIPLPPACTNDTIFIIVLPPNQPPVTVNEYIGLCSGSDFTGTLTNGGTVFNGDFDPENNLPLTVSVIPVQDPVHGVFTITDSLTGTFNYTPFTGYTGPDLVVVSICDSGIPVGCSNDTIFIEVLTPVIADAGPSQMLCNADVTFLVGNSPSPGTGSWAFVSGPNTPGIFPPTGSVAVVTGLIASPVPYIFSYTINIGGCQSTDTMSVMNYNPPTPSYAGIDQEFCSATGNVTTNLNANTPVFGTGEWTQLAGPNVAIILDPSDPNTLVTNLTYGAYAFQWLISNGVCQATADAVFIFISEPAVVDAGNNSTICEGSVHSLSSASASNYSSLLWSSSGTGIFSDPGQLNPIYTPSLTDVTNGIVVLTLTATANDPCPSVSDEMTLIITRSPIVFAGDDVTICTNSAYTVQDATAQFTSGYIWTTSGTGTLTGTTTLNPTYTPAPGETGDVELLLTGIANAPCSDVQDTMVISIVAEITVSAGPDTTICENDAYAVTGSAATNNLSLEWNTSGTGIFNNAGILNPVYTPSPNDINDGYVYLSLTATGNDFCPQATDEMKLSIARKPFAFAGPDAFVCSSSSFNITQATATDYDSIVWTTNGLGVLTGENTLEPVYTAAQGETGTIVLTIVATGHGSCLPATDQMSLTILPATTVNAGPDLSTCELSPVTIIGSGTENPSAIMWTSSGNGTFSDPTIINPVYTPGTVDVASGIVILTVYADGFSPCPGASDQTTLTINKAPFANAGPDATICLGISYTINQANASNYSTLQWSVEPVAAGTITNSETLTPTFTPAAGFSGEASLILRVQGSGTCSDVIISSAMSIYVNTSLVVDAGPDQEIMAGSNTVLAGEVTGGSGFYSWSWQPADLLVNPSIENPVTESMQSATTFTLTVMDILTGCMDDDTVRITLGSGGTSIVALADYDTTLVNVPVTIRVLENDINPNADPLTVSLCGFPSHGIVVLNSDKTITYTPYSDFAGDDMFCYRICNVVQPALCSDTFVYINVKVPDINDLIVYNGVSPNGDGNNDIWKIKGIEKYPDNTILIFNRWGDKVREFANYNNTTRSWDGTNENGDRLPDGTYFYILDVKNIGVLKGWIFIRGEK